MCTKYMELNHVLKENKLNMKIRTSCIQNINIMFTRMNCCCIENEAKRKNKLWRMYDDGKKRLDHELDIVNILT